MPPGFNLKWFNLTSAELQYGIILTLDLFEYNQFWVLFRPDLLF